MVMIQNGKSVVVRIPAEAQSEPNETSPLKNQTRRENNSDASSSASAVTSEQSAKQLIQSEDMMGQSTNVALKVGIDFLLLCSGKRTIFQ